jgi:hypothetical protein
MMRALSLGLAVVTGILYGQVPSQKVRVCDPATGACNIVATDGALSMTPDRPGRFVCRVSGFTSLTNMTCTPSLPPASGTYHYVDSVMLSNGPTAQTLKVISSTVSGCASSTADVTSTTYLGVNGGGMLHFFTPIKTAASASYLCCQSSGGGAASCTVTGFLGP